MELETRALDLVNASAGRIGEVARAIWEHPELGLQEQFAADLLCGELERAGFSITRGVAGMPTAFVASWGAGQPIIGILAEYDALAGLSQKVSTSPEPVVQGAPGHGCGHNLFGAASVGAAIAVKQALEEAGQPGTIRLYGCPAEETLIGKIFMARAGVYDDLSACLAWHPGSLNAGGGQVSSLAMNSFKVHFHGLAAHGAAAPHMGRSALDGCMLMDVGVNYLREHVEQEVRMHSVIPNGGGAPNIVPPYAQIWYYVRAPQRDQVDGVYARVLEIAQGAALMSGTTYEIEFLTGCHEMLNNDVIGDLMQAKLEKLSDPGYTDDERAFAEQLQATIAPDALEAGIRHLLKMSDPQVKRADFAGAVCDRAILPSHILTVMGGSTDVADVSKITPTASLSTCTEPIGTPGHSWQTVAASGHSFGVRGAVHATKALALTALDLFAKPELVTKAQEEFKRRMGGKGYVSPLPDGAWPHWE